MNLFGNYKIKFFPEFQTGVNRSLLTDMARAKYGFPLEGESPERFLATKVPLRKNKDYRARFRNFVVGYPVYKKDNYMRHYYNFIDIFVRDFETPIIRYTKIYMASWVTVFAPVLMVQDLLPSSQALSVHKIRMSYNFHAPKAIIDQFRMGVHFAKPYCNGFAVAATAWFILKDYFQLKRHFSNNQSMLIASGVISPAVVFMLWDRPITGFWYQAFLLGLFTSTYTNKTHFGYGHNFSAPEKIYLKGVSKEEQLKIEFQDTLESFAEDFDQTYSHTMYESYWNNKMSFLALK